LGLGEIEGDATQLFGAIARLDFEEKPFSRPLGLEIELIDELLR
jgi:hypothetical protein